MAERYAVAIVGGGPGGYVAAIRCMQLGLSTALIERDALGGLCLNRGCIPTKAMLHAAGAYPPPQPSPAPPRGGTNASLLGWGERVASPPPRTGEGEGGGETSPEPPIRNVSYLAALAQRDAAVGRLFAGLTNLLRTAGVTVIQGTARIHDSNTLQVRSADGERVVGFDHLVLAPGSQPTRPSIPGADLPGVIDSDQALALSASPKRAVIVGGGAVGVEWAEIWRAFGSEVTVIEVLPQLLPTEEPEIGRELARLFHGKGITCLVGATLLEIRPTTSGLAVVAHAGHETRTLPVDTVLMATGRRPSIEGLNLERLSVKVERAGIPTDAFMRTNVAHVYAVGDVTGRAMLAHVASHQGIVAAESIAGEPQPFDDRAIPSVVFTDPEVASVGLRQRQATDLAIPVRVGRFPFAASGRAQATGQTAGFVKIIARADSGEILGAHIIGPRAGDLIAEATLALRLHATLADLAHTIHPHPTFSEGLMEAAWAALDAPIHIPGRRPRRA